MEPNLDELTSSTGAATTLLRAAITITTTPTTTDPNAATWALLIPQYSRGLIRTNSTRNRPSPLSARYTPVSQPIGLAFRPSRHSSHASANANRNS